MNDSRLVYSTSKSPDCPGCHKSLGKCRCQLVQDNGRPRRVSEQVIRLSRETKGRKGKGVTLITGFSLQETEIKALARKLKALCGSGGTVKQGRIEIQGDHRELIKQELEKDFQNVKLAGGYAVTKNKLTE